METLKLQVILEHPTRLPPPIIHIIVRLQHCICDKSGIKHFVAQKEAACNLINCILPVI